MTQDTMAEIAPEAVRDYVLNNPARILEDPVLMAALVAADDQQRGANVVDMRGMAMSALEGRLDRLQSTHQSVLSAAYENVSTTAQVHRAILAMIAPLELESFLRCIGSDVADILRVGSVRILLETRPHGDMAALPASPCLVEVDPGVIETYQNAARAGRSRDVVLRPVDPELPILHDLSGGRIRSEALLRLELGAAYPAGLLVLGATDPEQYQPDHATDLFELFGRVFERTLRSLLSR